MPVSPGMIPKYSTAAIAGPQNRDFRAAFTGKVATMALNAAGITPKTISDDGIGQSRPIHSRLVTTTVTVPISAFCRRSAGDWILVMTSTWLRLALAARRPGCSTVARASRTAEIARDDCIAFSETASNAAASSVVCWLVRRR